jgi:hypothetical protein
VLDAEHSSLVALLALVRLVGAVAIGATVLVGGCKADQPCCGLCPASQEAVFQLTCASTDLTSVTSTGPCASNASLAATTVDDVVAIGSDGPGVCHVVLTFATGFTYSADVTFASKPGGVCGGPQCTCPDYVAPTGGPFAVQNPGSTCVDAGPDADAGP